MLIFAKYVYSIIISIFFAFTTAF